jgi:hypothetical protein
MKQIPFKCQRGHVSIKKFQDDEEKPSQIECEECSKLDGANKQFVFIDSRCEVAYSKSSYNWTVKTEKSSIHSNHKPKMAVRF